MYEPSRTITLQAHFDGRVFVPDEPVDIPAGVSLTLQVRADEIAEKGSLVAIRSGIGRIKAPEGFDPSKVVREELYD